MITLKHTFQQLLAFRDIVGNYASILVTSKEDMNHLAGLVLQELHSRLSRKTDFGFTGVKSVKLNTKECLALHRFLQLITPQTGGGYYDIIRNEVFTLIDRKLCSSPRSDSITTPTSSWSTSTASPAESPTPDGSEYREQKFTSIPTEAPGGTIHSGPGVSTVQRS